MNRPPFLKRKFLVDPELQIGLSMEMIGWIYAYFLGFSVLWNLPSLWALVTAPAADAAHVAALDEIRAFARYAVVPMAVTFVLMSIHGVFMTHRIAGPTVRLKRTMREIAARRLPAPLTLRRRDHFRDLADEINAAVAVLREDSTRRRRMSVATADKLRALVAALENRPSDLRAVLALANAALDDAESLSRHLDATTDATAADARRIPLPDAELPAVVDADLDELDPEPHHQSDRARASV